MRNDADFADLPKAVREALDELRAGPPDPEFREREERWRVVAARVGVTDERELRSIVFEPRRVDTGHSAPLSSRKDRPRSARRWMSLGLATASVAIVGLAAIRAFQHGASSAPEKTYHTTSGQIATFQTTDGSMVTLGPATTVDVASDRMRVTGEAHFVVPPRAARPFIVETSNAVIHVLGTEFTVRQYATEHTSRVVVADGKVALQRAWDHVQGRSRTVLTARMLAQVTDSGIAVQQGIAVNDYTAWTHGNLVFNAVALRDVVQDLSRAYGTEIRLADSALARQPVTLEASVRDDSLAMVLKRIAFTLSAHVIHEASGFMLVAGRPTLRGPNPGTKDVPHQEKQYGR